MVPENSQLKPSLPGLLKEYSQGGDMSIFYLHGVYFTH